MSHRIFAALLILGTTATLTAQSNPSFELYRDTNSVFSPAGIVQGDFNRDGKPDVIIAGGAADNDLTLRLGNGDGTFQPPRIVGTVGATNMGGITTADLNNDGKLDLIAFTYDQNFEVFYGNGDGTFQSPLTFSTAHLPESITAGNYNSDGFLDLAVGEDNGAVQIFNNVGGKNFEPGNMIQVSSSTQFRVLRIASGDVDGNGTIDLAVLTENGAYVLWGDGHRDFTPVELASYAYPVDLNVGDLNQDGLTDMLVSYQCSAPVGPKGTPVCAAFDVFYGQQNRSTAKLLAVLNNNNSSAGQPWAVDVNGDGIADIVAPADHQDGDGLFVWLGNANGTFNQTPLQYIATTDHDTEEIVPGDWNRDGMIDFAQALGSAAQTEFYINGGRRAPCASGQINPTVVACQPVNDTYSPSPVRAEAIARDTNDVTTMQQYVDNKLAYSTHASSFNITLPENPGPHFFAAKGWSAGATFSHSDSNITVYSGTPGPSCPAALGKASICLPAGATSGSPVHILANAYPSTVPTDVQLYIDGRLVVNNPTDGNSYIDTSQTLSSGSHSLTFKVWDANGHSYAAEKTIMVN